LFAIGADWQTTSWPAELGEPPARLRRRDDLLWALDGALLPPGRAGAFNEAMMELGATVCLPRAPKCDLCPSRARPTRLGAPIGESKHHPSASR
jgi:adenine-specific DNA glycosylase